MIFLWSLKWGNDNFRWLEMIILDGFWDDLNKTFFLSNYIHTQLASQIIHESAILIVCFHANVSLQESKLYFTQNHHLPYNLKIYILPGLLFLCLHMITLRTRYSNTIYHLICLELSVSNDCKIELREVGGLPKAQLVESWLPLYSRYNFPVHGWAKSYKACISCKLLKNWPTKDFLVADNFPFERGTLSNSVLWKTWQLCKTLWEIFSLARRNRL